MEEQFEKSLPKGLMLANDEELNFKRKINKSYFVKKADKQEIEIKKTFIKETIPEGLEQKSETSNKRRNIEVKNLPNLEENEESSKKNRKILRVFHGQVFDTILKESNYESKGSFKESQFDRQMIVKFKDWMKSGKNFDLIALEFEVDKPNLNILSEYKELLEDYIMPQRKGLQKLIKSKRGKKSTIDLVNLKSITYLLNASKKEHLSLERLTNIYNSKSSNIKIGRTSMQKNLKNQVKIKV